MQIFPAAACSKQECALNLVANSLHNWFFLSVLYWWSLGMWTEKIFGFSSVLSTSQKIPGTNMCHLLPWTMKIALIAATGTTNQKICCTWFFYQESLQYPKVFITQFLKLDWVVSISFDMTFVVFSLNVLFETVWKCVICIYIWTMYIKFWRWPSFHPSMFVLSWRLHRSMDC